MAESAAAIKERILDALEEIEQSDDPKVATIARNHKVPY